jgi:HSP20 family protein
MRMMAVPEGIDPSSVYATFKDGVLTVTVPKPAEAKQQAKKIEIKSAA